VTVSQLVTLLKDTSLGFVIGFEELLRTANSTGEYYRNVLQSLTIAAALYIAVNFSLSRLAHRLEIRQRRRLGAGSVTVAGLEDLAVVDAAGRSSAAE
jgi:glutamate transport system permease protein